MVAPKISAMENEPRNLTIGTMIRVAHALRSPSRLPSFLRASRVNRVEIKLVRRKGRKLGRRNGGGKVKNRSS
jgi:hypothetical protein